MHTFIRTFVEKLALPVFPVSRFRAKLHTMRESLPAPTLASFLRERCARELMHAWRVLSDGAGDRDEAVHEGRKCVRRVRAWLRLAPRGVRERLAAVDAQLRSVRRALGPLRDAHTRCEALGKLRKRRDLGELRVWLTDARKRLKDVLTARWLRRPRHGRAWTRMLSSLEALAGSVADWPLEDLTVKHAQRALQRSFLRARVARRECAGRNAAELRHQWRGRVRILVLQCQLLESFGALAGCGDFKDLGQGLGDEHDLAVVSRELGRLELPIEAQRALRSFLRQQRLALALRNDRSARHALRRSRTPKLRRIHAVNTPTAAVVEIETDPALERVDVY